MCVCVHAASLYLSKTELCLGEEGGELLLKNVIISFKKKKKQAELFGQQ